MRIVLDFSSPGNPLIAEWTREVNPPVLELDYRMSWREAVLRRNNGSLFFGKNYKQQGERRSYGP